MLPIVDTHQHMWDLAQFALPWLEGEGMEPLRKNYLMSDYLAAGAGAGIARTVYMEVDVAAAQHIAEAEFVAGLCRADDNPMAGAVIGGSPGEEGFRAYIDRFKDEDAIKGVRQVLHVPDAEPGHCLQEGFVRDVQYLGEIGMSFDLCLRPGELGDAVGLVDQCPDTLFIVDHCGNADPQIVNGAAEHDPANPFSHTKEQWQGDIATLAVREHVVCKISGIIARAPAGWSADTLAPTVNHCLDSFGPDRVVFGGDWPVCNFGASLGAVGGCAAGDRLRAAGGRAGQIARWQCRAALRTGVSMDPFEKVAIGNTGVEVTRLGLGGAPLGGMVLADGIFVGSAYDEALAIIRRAYEMGVRYFDTAPMYGDGRSEVRYGRVLGEFPRESFAISTKGSRVLRPENPDDLAPYSEDGIPHYVYDFDFSAEGLRASLDSSLERLGLAAVDIFFVHDSDFKGQHTDEDFIEALEAAVELRATGTVKAIGMGMNEWERTGRMVERFDLDYILLAGRYTLLDQSALPEFLPLCVERGVKLTMGGPYNSGILARDLSQPVSFDYLPAPEHLVQQAKALKAVCDRHGVELRAAALQFPFGHEAVISAVPGAASVAELEDNARVMQVEIPPALWAELKAEGLLPEGAPTP